MLAAGFVMLVGLMGVLSPTASAQDGDLVIVIPPVEVETTETTTTVMQVEPTGATVAALTITVEFPDVVFLAATEPLVNGFCEVDGNQVRFSAFEVTGWATTTDLCRITLRGGQVAGSGTPTITISVAADPISERLTGTTQPGTITVGSAPAPPTVVTTTPTPEPTVEPTPEPTVEPTPESDTTDAGSDDPAPSPTPEDVSSDADADPAEGSGTEDEADPAPDSAAEDSAVDDASGNEDTGGRVDGDVTDPADEDAPSADTPSDSTGPEAEASTEDAETGDEIDDGEAAQPDDASDADAASESASPAPLPLLPAAESNQPLLVAIVAAALFAVGALLALGARKANRDSGTPR
jgi:hypothetical protein